MGRAGERLAAARQLGHASFQSIALCGAIPMAGLEISPTKVGYVIVKAREYAAKVGAWDDGPTSDHDADSILEAFSEDATQIELREFIQDLNEDEQISLVALAWIGRGSFGPEELDEAMATARAERTGRTEDYLIGMPLLPDYLEEALDRLGYSVEDAEDDAMGD
jgi:Protein of unknown function (DUF3775)